MATQTLDIPAQIDVSQASCWPVLAPSPPKHGPGNSRYLSLIGAKYSFSLPHPTYYCLLPLTNSPKLQPVAHFSLHASAQPHCAFVTLGGRSADLAVLADALPSRVCQVTPHQLRVVGRGAVALLDFQESRTLRVLGK